MDEPLPPMKGFDWDSLRNFVEQVDEMLKTAEHFEKTVFEVEGIPEEFVGPVAEEFRGRGLEVFKGRNRLKVLVNSGR